MTNHFTTMDLIVKEPNLTVEVRVWWYTKSGKWAYVGNPFQPISEAFKVSTEKLREV